MHFKEREITKSCEEIHTILDKIEEIHGLYSPVTLAVAAALACACFTFLLGGGPIEDVYKRQVYDCTGGSRTRHLHHARTGHE